MSDGPPHLVIGHDGREASQHALSVAAALTMRLGAHLDIVHVVDLHDYPIDPDSPDWEERAAAALKEEYERVSSHMEGVGVDWTYYPERGEPVQALISVADEHDALMIVVGARSEGFGASAQRLLGGRSVSQGLIREHSRPVLVVP